MTQAEQYCLVDRILVKLDLSENGPMMVRPVLTPEDCSKYVAHAHLSPLCHHQGTTKLYMHLKKQIYCLKLYNIIRDFVANCPICLQKRGPPTHLDNFDFSAETRLEGRQPLDVCFADVKVLPQNGFFRYILVIADQFSRYVIVEPLKTKSCEEMTNVLIKTACINGTMKKLVVDADSAFTAKLLKKLVT